MGKLTREILGDEVVLHLEGVLEGSLDLKAAVGSPPSKLRIDCLKVRHANSSLVRPWIDFFESLRQAGTHFRFTNCPSSLIEYFNFVPPFACGGPVESVLAPFFCGKCKRETQMPVETRDLPTALASVAAQHCPGCKTVLSFDDKPEEYFEFLTRQAAS